MLRILGCAAIAAIATADGGTAWPSLEESHVMATADYRPATTHVNAPSSIDVAALLSAARGAPTPICSLASQAIGNGNWGGWGDVPVPPLGSITAPEPDHEEDVDDLGRHRGDRRFSSEDVDRLLQALGSDDACVRQLSVRLLGREDGDPKVESGLLSRLGDSNVQMRQVAAIGLGLIESDAAVNPLIQALRDTSVAVRANAAWALGRIENGRALGALSAVLRDREEVVRTAAVVSIAQMDSVSAAAALTRVLREDQSAAVRRSAAWGLGQLEAHEAVDALASAVAGDKDARVREMAAWALGNIEDSKATSALLNAARRDDSDSVREMAVWAIAQIEDRSAVTALGEIAGSDRSARVRGTAAWALGQVQDDDDGHVPPGLIKALADESAEVRLKAAWALGQIGDSSALPAIRDAMQREKDQRVTKALIRALMKSGERSETELSKLLDSPDPAVREAAVRALAGGGSRDPWPWPNPRPRPFP